MLTCRDLAHQADAFLNGELSRAQRLRIRLHMSMCSGCARFMGQMRTTRTLTRAEADCTDLGEDARIDSILDTFNEENSPAAKMEPDNYKGLKK